MSLGPFSFFFDFIEVFFFLDFPWYLCLLFFANKRGRRHSVRIDVAAGLLICSTYDRCRLKNGLGTLSPSGVYFGFFFNTHKS